MDPTSSNPLAKHFRQPAIYLKLPSKGQYWPEDAIRMPVNGEVAIYPMTTKDEITLRTPDALMNGAGVISVIQSCCPEIVDAWRMPSIDVDAVIIAIRIASYGATMEFTSQCPACKEIDNYGLSLQSALDQIRLPDYVTPVETASVKIKLTPQPYFSLNETNQAQYEEQKLLQTIESTDLDPTVRGIEIAKHMEKLIQIGASTLTSSTEYIEADGVRVTNKEHIKEFYQNSNATVVKAVQARLAEINVAGAIKPMHVNCSACNHPFDIQITFDYSAFFGLGS